MRVVNAMEDVKVCTFTGGYGRYGINGVVSPPAAHVLHLLTASLSATGNRGGRETRPPASFTGKKRRTPKVVTQLRTLSGRK